MNTTPRDFVTVDMRGLKAALVTRSLATRRSVSDLVRTAVGEWLADAPPRAALPISSFPVTARLSRLSIRLAPQEAALLAKRSRQAGVSQGVVIAGLLEGVPLMAQSMPTQGEAVSALVSSNAQISTLARYVYKLCVLLERGDGKAAREYWQELTGLVTDVHEHLRVSADVLDLLRARRGPVRQGDVDDR